VPFEQFLNGFESPDLAPLIGVHQPRERREQIDYMERIFTLLRQTKASLIATSP
jgi:hypothetical protein